MTIAKTRFNLKNWGKNISLARRHLEAKIVYVVLAFAIKAFYMATLREIHRYNRWLFCFISFKSCKELLLAKKCVQLPLANANRHQKQTRNNSSVKAMLIAQINLPACVR